MKVLMYHYVRPAPEDLPHFRYLHVDHFTAQLDFFEQRFGFLTREEFDCSVSTGIPKSGVLLTFDDGFVDHFRYVLPVLEERGLWAIFYVPTGIYESSSLLDVHRIHLLLGRFGGKRCVEMLGRLTDGSIFPDTAVEEFRTHTYRTQTNDEATLLFKRMLNFYISYDHRRKVLDLLMENYLDGSSESDLQTEFYMTPDQVADLVAAGCVVGSHSVNHHVMSKLDPADQRQEIEASFDALARITGGPIETFCYPHGGFHTFTRETERLLQETGARYSFNVEPRAVEGNDLRHRPQALPRYDCNLFPNGMASEGTEIASG